MFYLFSVKRIKRCSFLSILKLSSMVEPTAHLLYKNKTLTSVLLSSMIVPIDCKAPLSMTKFQCI